VRVDGTALQEASIPLLDDGREHRVEVTMGDNTGSGPEPSVPI
jgi:hypothetical protein